MMLSLRQIRKSYPIGPTQVEVLKGVDLNVGAGEFMAITGPSGCGKSTLMNVLGLLDRPTSGEFFLNDQAVSYDNDDHLSDVRNRHIGFVFQQYMLLARMTALENVALPLVYRGTPLKQVQTLCMSLLERVGMADRAQHRPAQLSGGQQQRVAIARALAGSPALILADEPTGALDSRVGEEIMRLFKQLNTQDGLTVILITHDLNIARQCPRSVVMRDGAILV
jgi:putative ABC transport system ATP-binding protein